MVHKFEWRPFSEINVNDPFFDTLKTDYPEFATEWFPKCIQEKRNALVFYDEEGLGAFVALKRECEPIFMQERTIPATNRLKVSTLRLAPRFRGQRLGEGALGLVLWNWQRSKLDEIYLTVFPQHTDLISQLERFGFKMFGKNERGERIYMRSRKNIDFSDPYKAFPFISPEFKNGGYLIVDDVYHDTLFPYSELKNTPQEILQIDAANGISKVYIGAASKPQYRVGEPIFIYRKYTGLNGKPGYKSCLTSYCVVTDIKSVKENGKSLVSFDEFLAVTGNKTVFSRQELKTRFENDKTITVITMLYCGYFGSGRNINMVWLSQNGLWADEHQYPARIRLSQTQCRTIWNTAKVNLDNVCGGQAVRHHNDL